MIYAFTIPGVLPDYNNALDKAKGDQRGIQYRAWKRKTDEAIAWEAKRQLRGVRGLCGFSVVIRWYKPDNRKDHDNISHATKYILDGLQDAGTIQNDGPKQVWDIVHNFFVDQANPRTEIFLIVGQRLILDIEKFM